MDARTPEIMPPAPADPRQTTGLGCAALAVSALVVFGYALFKYQQAMAPEVTEPDAPVLPLDGPPSPPGPPAAL